MKNVKEFYEALAKDKEMQERAKALNSKNPENEEAVLAATVEFAKKEGYDITAEEIREYLKTNATLELSDSEMAAVTGGVSAVEACYCVFGGGGSGKNDDACVCVMGGAATGTFCWIIGYDS